MLPTLPWTSLPHRPAVKGTRHMVAAGHHLATQAGLQILEAGGNAVDAGVAAGIALGVVQSDMVNVAGVAPIMVYMADRRELKTVSGLGTWPKSVTAEYFMKECAGKIPFDLRRTVVPAAPDAWITALEHWGTMSFGDVAAAAIRFARDGFPISSFMASQILERISDYERYPSTSAIYLPGGKPPRAGEVFVQADLGRTLQYMADEERAKGGGDRLAGLGAARDAFYRGDIARAIDEFFRREGGFLTFDDMAGFTVDVENPASLEFGELEVFACGPWCQGPMLLQSLSLLDGIALHALGHNSSIYVHTLTEAVKLAFADRERWYGDPKFVDVPLDALLSRPYALQRRTLFRASRAFPGMPPSGDPLTCSAVAPRQPKLPPPSSAPPPPPADTSYCCVVDRWGNVFSATPSDVTWDSPIVPGTGLCPSSRGSQSRADPDHPASVA
ncbi:MAG: gamma-glutamyltransferase family protein, partial [Alphaproteobacteria bacterium]|nr:gamma-glutamyltransferase family protein [Alphaproteobacteria bacterium]